MGKYRNNKNRLMKERIMQYLGGKKCRVCGVDYLLLPCYAFHHQNGNKNKDISRMIGEGASWAEIKKEIDDGDCIPVCLNCHATIHTLGSGRVGCGSVLVR